MSHEAAAKPTSPSFLEARFKLSERKTTIGTEIYAGFITFLAMSYILAVNLRSWGIFQEWIVVRFSLQRRWLRV
ncbi:xanthine/uracil/thiamine/ascorbate permease family protein [Vibrio astriarenae]|nr:xanthine/uracil/thiamine/ascorbate permease family protein [Vibrio sp. C7]